MKIEITRELVEAWQWELAVQVQKCRAIETASGTAKANFLEGAYSVLSALLRAHSGEPSPSPLSTKINPST